MDNQISNTLVMVDADTYSLNDEDLEALLSNLANDWEKPSWWVLQSIMIGSVATQDDNLITDDNGNQWSVDDDGLCIKFSANNNEG